MRNIFKKEKYLTSFRKNKFYFRYLSLPDSDKKDDKKDDKKLLGRKIASAPKSDKPLESFPTGKLEFSYFRVFSG